MLHPLICPYSFATKYLFDCRGAEYTVYETQDSEKVKIGTVFHPQSSAFACKMHSQIFDADGEHLFNLGP